MFKMQSHVPEAFGYTRGVIVSVIACFVLLACLVIADKIFWNDHLANRTQYDRHRWNTSG
jgi:hypothetical protein